jgi:hypothetical protein
MTQPPPLKAIAHEALLQASRRIDWRFLLPTPDLGRVACLGVADAGLLESLDLFSAELEVVDSSSGGELDAVYDVVVLRNPNRRAIAAGWRLLRPGGWAYLEVETSIPSKQGDALCSVRVCARELRKLGLVEISTFVHWPDFDSCRAIVPLDEAAAVRHGLARGGTNGSGRLARLAPALAATRQLGRFVPCASVVGRRPVGGEAAQ